MEWLGFMGPVPDDIVEDKSHSFKLVPWMSWDEWKFISTWRSRGCTAVAIEVTASIVEIQQQDPFFRNDLNENASQSEEMLAMLYCMAIMRLVNEGSHRDLLLQLVRLASKKERTAVQSHTECLELLIIQALDWLVSYYWKPQEEAIPTQSNQAAKLRKEIKRRLREVALCLKTKQMAKSSSSHVKGKRESGLCFVLLNSNAFAISRYQLWIHEIFIVLLPVGSTVVGYNSLHLCSVRQTEHLYGRSKLLFLMAGKTSHSTNLAGSKKQLAKSLKNILRLYSSLSPEVVNVLLEYLLSTLGSSNLAEHLEDSQIVNEISKLLLMIGNLSS
ncbi:hypothetical protein Sango_2736400 [Sesamum angolense]|uniref:Las1-like family protein n=1 Tax=Sesamum angolense TaxID=2727404 RepID=A0AAE1VYR5_9LAMI|nr:hypothetical protein Sango_2736400 [Sesamum angolense]